ncbi:hypothetical protein NN6n1_04560 [Shinella zoogloeoides]
MQQPRLVFEDSHASAREIGVITPAGGFPPRASTTATLILCVLPERRKATPGLLHIGRQLQDHTGGRMMRTPLEAAHKAHAKGGAILDQKVIETQRYRMDILSDREGGFVHLVEFCGVATGAA